MFSPRQPYLTLLCYCDLLPSEYSDTITVEFHYLFCDDTIENLLRGHGLPLTNIKMRTIEFGVVYLCLLGGDLGLDDLDDAGVLHSAGIAELIGFASDDLAHNTAHDLKQCTLVVRVKRMCTVKD